ncbi:MAG TPA: nitronate monooxygenase, partial [Woeseiaceae bacterium]|nr:nitronate monooxygenase [Woeseiaceae bacterium]
MSALTDALGMEIPVFQAPMAGGADTPELVAEVCRAGGMGFLGCAYSTPTQILSMARAVRSRTSRPYGVNLFAPAAFTVDDEVLAGARSSLAHHYATFGLEPPAVLSEPLVFEAQFEAVLATGAAAFSFTLGMISEDCIRSGQRAGMVVLGTATTVDEARALERAGVDAVIAQGSEAGGHRGSFLRDPASCLVDTSSLVQGIREALTIPVVASGGIMDGRGI